MTITLKNKLMVNVKFFVFTLVLFTSLPAISNDSTCIESQEFENSTLRLTKTKNIIMTPEYGEYYGYKDLYYVPTGASKYSSTSYKIELNINGQAVQLNEGSLDDGNGIIYLSRYPRLNNPKEEIVLIGLMDLMLEYPVESHLVYAKKNSILTYLGSVKTSPLKPAPHEVPKQPISYFSELTVLDKGDEIVIYSQSNFESICRKNTFPLPKMHKEHDI